MGKERKNPEKAAGTQNILELEAVSTLISSFRSIFQVFTDLGAVDAASVLSRILLSGSTKKPCPASSCKVG
jgi:hypothetical protein